MFSKRKNLKYAAVRKEGDEEIDFQDSKKYILTPSCVRSSVFTAVLLCTYFAPSIVLTFYQRWLFQVCNKIRFFFVLKYVILGIQISIIYRTRTPNNKVSTVFALAPLQVM